MNTKSFIDTLVSIDIIEGTKSYGHYPFQIASIDKDNKLSLGALFLGGDVEAVYKTAKKLVIEGSVKLFLSIDFPANNDIQHDFIAVYTLTDRFVECLAIPYNSATGERYPEITNGKQLYWIKKQFENIVLF